MGPNRTLFFRDVDNTWKNGDFALSETANVNTHFFVRFKRTKGRAVSVTLPASLNYAGWYSDAQMPKNL